MQTGALFPPQFSSCHHGRDPPGLWHFHTLCIHLVFRWSRIFRITVCPWAQGLAIVISNAEPFVASLLGFFLWQDCPPCVNQLYYGRKAFLALQCPVSGSDSSSILLLLLSFALWIHAESPTASRRWVLCPAQEMAICTDTSETASLQRVAVVSGLRLTEGQT